MTDAPPAPRNDRNLLLYTPTIHINAAQESIRMPSVHVLGVPMSFEYGLLIASKIPLPEDELNDNESWEDGMRRVMATHANAPQPRLFNLCPWHERDPFNGQDNNGQDHYYHMFICKEPEQNAWQHSCLRDELPKLEVLQTREKFALFKFEEYIRTCRPVSTWPEDYAVEFAKFRGLLR